MLRWSLFLWPNLGDTWCVCALIGYFAIIIQKKSPSSRLIAWLWFYLIDLIKQKTPSLYYLTHCGREVLQYAHRFSVCRVRRLKECPDGRAATAWTAPASCVTSTEMSAKNAATILKTSRAQYSLNRFYTLWNMLLTGLHHSLLVSVSLLLPTNSSILPLHLSPLLSSLTCVRVGGNHHHQ